MGNAGIRINGREFESRSSPVIAIGRDPSSGVVFSDRRVSGKHAEVRATPRGWLFRDLSKRGSFKGGTPITELVVAQPTRIRLADPKDGPVLELVPSRTPAGADSAPGGPVPIPPIEINGRAFDANSSQQIRIGRDPSSDVVLSDRRVSGQHAEVRASARGWVYRDSSKRGSFKDGARVRELFLGQPARIRLADPTDGPIVKLIPGSTPANQRRVPAPDLAASIPSQLGKLSRVHPLAGSRVRIGRDPRNDLVLSDLRVSRRHAELLRRPDATFELVDVGSSHGTFVNGRKIDRALLGEGDVVAIGSHLLRFTRGNLEEYEDRGEAWLLAAGLSVSVDGKTILDDVSFPVPPQSLIAVVGPSGVGKTTLLNALTGFRPAGRGKVVYGGRDLYENYEELRLRMGFVPQEDILHSQLSVRTALNYAAMLRFPPDVDGDARRRRIDEVLTELGIGQRANLRIDRLSGGQRKRVSVGLEVLTKPSLLFLDEPTSGLDPGNESQVMHLLRELADGGCTVVVVTHSTQSLHLCDRVLFLAPGGRTAFYGPPNEATTYFTRVGAGNEYSEVFRVLDERRGSDWRDRFASDPAADRYVRKPLAEAQIQVDGHDRRKQRPDAPRRPQPWFRQFRILSRRYVALLASEKKNLALLALQAPIFGLLFMILIGPNRLSTTHGPEATLLVWLIVIGATWLGTSNAIREIVKELPIYRRERAVGLSVSAYVGSKAAILATITVIQAIVLVLVSTVRQPLPPIDPMAGRPGREQIPPLAQDGAALGSALMEFTLGIILTGLAAMAMGLLISALTRTSDRALTLLPIILITQVVLSVPFLPTQSPVIRTAGLVSSAQWGTAAAASTVSLNQLRTLFLLSIEVGHAEILNERPSEDRIQDALEGEERWRHEPDVWATSALVLGGMTVAFIVAAAVVLRVRDPTFVRIRPRGTPAKRRP